MTDSDRNRVKIPQLDINGADLFIIVFDFILLSTNTTLTNYDKNFYLHAFGSDFRCFNARLTSFPAAWLSHLSTNR